MRQHDAVSNIHINRAYMNTTSNVRHCPKCDKTKSLSNFSKDSTNKSGHACYCKFCVKEKNTKYLRTRNGLSFKMYSGQKTSSKRRGHNPPNYNLTEFRDWLYSQHNFEYLFLQWIESNYSKMLIPSADRIEDELPYTLGNIKLVTFLDNHIKEIKKRPVKKRKPVFRIDLKDGSETEYKSLREACRQNNIKPANISNCCNGKRLTTGGYGWRF